MKKDKFQINFLSSDAEKRARRTTVLVAGVFTLLVAVLSAVGADMSYRAAGRGVSVFSEVGNFFSLNSIAHLTWDNGNPSESKDPFSTPDGRLNILFLGIGGDGHDGPQLTDTIIFSSYNKDDNKMGLVSVPRDLAFPLGNGRFEKINSVNAYNEMDHPGQGSEFTAQAFSKLFNTRIDRVVKIDFKGFEDLVDALGGIDVTIEKTFTDYQFPTDDDGPDPYKWTSVTFTKGVEHMSGKRALTYARSRHAAGSEGSDFARSRRQHLVIEAVRDRLLSLGTLSDPKKLSDLWTALSTHIQTNFTAWDLLKLVPYASKLTHVSVSTRVLTDDPATGELVAGNVNGAFMLFPKKSDWTEIQDIIAHPFDSDSATPDAKTASAPALPKPKGIMVEIRNGTFKTGFAAQISSVLQKNGYSVSGTSNAAQRNFTRTMVYDLTKGAQTDELAKLKTFLNADIASPDATGQIILSDGTHEPAPNAATQFLILLGTASANLVQ